VKTIGRSYVSESGFGLVLCEQCKTKFTQNMEFRSVYLKKLDLFLLLYPQKVPDQVGLIKQTATELNL
jgi:hypothetical protein